jgi:hypothetical protein
MGPKPLWSTEREHGDSGAHRLAHPCGRFTRDEWIKSFPTASEIDTEAFDGKIKGVNTLATGMKKRKGPES